MAYQNNPDDFWDSYPKNQQRQNVQQNQTQDHFKTLVEDVRNDDEQGKVDLTPNQPQPQAIIDQRQKQSNVFFGQAKQNIIQSLKGAGQDLMNASQPLQRSFQQRPGNVFGGSLAQQQRPTQQHQQQGQHQQRVVYVPTQQDKIRGMLTGRSNYTSSPTDQVRSFLSTPVLQSRVQHQQPARRQQTQNRFAYALSPHLNNSVAGSSRAKLMALLGKRIK